MELTISLSQKQSTQLMMTTELRVAISLLQYSVFDLFDYIQEQAISNPLIELETTDSKEAIIEKSLSRSEGKPTPTKSNDSPLNYLNLERTTLHEYLVNQVRLLPIAQNDFQDLTHFIYAVDNNGYLTVQVEELCQELNITIEKGMSILHQLQNLEPVGIGARTLQECILLQLNKLVKRNPIAERIVSEYFDLFCSKKWSQISKELLVNRHEIQLVQDLIQTLQPRPGTSHNSDVTNYVVPEVSVIKVNDEFIPKINLSKEYKHLLNKKKSEAYSYIKEKYDEFKWLHQSIIQRQSTLFQVTNAIVTYQKDFFNDGLKSLKPLTLKQIAEEIDVHESTISRITSNKYVATPRGVFELKYFFTAGIVSKDQDQISTSYIKELIKAMIDREDKSKPLSDQDLVLAIRSKEKIQPSRRVIAKYRNEMRIPSSTQRRRFYE